jgi:hypothetical protein
MVTWLTRNPNLSALRPIEAHRLVGMMMLSPTLTDYASFRATLAADDVDPALAAAGRRCLALVVRDDHLPVADPTEKLIGRLRREPSFRVLAATLYRAYRATQTLRERLHALTVRRSRVA